MFLYFTKEQNKGRKFDINISNGLWMSKIVEGFLAIRQMDNIHSQLLVLFFLNSKNKHLYLLFHHLLTLILCQHYPGCCSRWRCYHQHHQECRGTRLHVETRWLVLTEAALHAVTRWDWCYESRINLYNSIKVKSKIFVLKTWLPLPQKTALS